MTDLGERDDGTAATETLRHTYDWETTQPSAAIVEMVAIATDRDPLDLTPLFATVDPDALDVLVRRGGDGRTAADTRVSLQYADHDVSLRSDGEITVTPIAAGGDSA